jgi:DeoR/GlpR family transcriptional regulator of sugar metabolism
MSVSAMLTDERHDIIRALLLADGRVLANELALKFGVSEDTVRRDLRELAKAGFCRRVHGGALAPAPQVPPIERRIETATTAKAKLAAVAAGLVHTGQTIFIDAGSTNFAIASALPQDLELTVVTNAPGAVTALSAHPKVRIILLGGSFDRERGSTGGSSTLRDIGNLYADLFFLGSCALDAQFGVSALDPVEAEVKRAMVAQSRATAIAVTSNKLNTAAPFRVAPPEAVTHLIVEPDADEALLTVFAALGTMVHPAG